MADTLTAGTSLPGIWKPKWDQIPDPGAPLPQSEVLTKISGLRGLAFTG